MTAQTDAGRIWPIAVLMQRDALQSPWQRWRWSLHDVLPAPEDAASPPRCVAWGTTRAQWLYPGCAVQLYRDEAEGYHLNLTAPQPSWFVWWTAPALADCDDPRLDPAGLPAIQAVTLSYNEAARWMDAGETIEIAPLPAAVANWLAAFTQQHYRPEPRKRRRPQSFLAPEQRAATTASAPPAAASAVDDRDEPPACCL